MRKPAEVTDLDAFLRVVGAPDLGQVEEILLARAQFHDDDGEAEVSPSASGVYVELRAPQIDGQGFDIAFPFALDQFWAQVDELDRLNLRRVRMRQLPESPLDDEFDFHDTVDRSELLEGLAAYFEVHESALTHLIGGGWGTLDVPVDDESVDWIDRFWIFSGDPLMVALGLGYDDVRVGSPTLIPRGLAGPASVVVDQVGTVDLHADDRLINWLPS